MTGPAGAADAAGAQPGAPGGRAPGPVSAADVAAITMQLGRPPRGAITVAHRCPCGLPDVVQTVPRLPDGSPFPTLFYLTCPRAAAAMSRLEAAGLMRVMTQQIASDPATREACLAAHHDYLSRRDAAAQAAGIQPLPPGSATAGGMPERVKCLHALAAHELAVPGVNLLGREAIAAAVPWWPAGPCVTLPAPGPGRAGGPDGGAKRPAGRQGGTG